MGGQDFYLMFDEALYARVQGGLAAFLWALQALRIPVLTMKQRSGGV